MNVYDWTQIAFSGVKIIGELALAGVAASQRKKAELAEHQQRAALEVNAALDYIRGVAARADSDNEAVLAEARREDQP